MVVNTLYVHFVREQRGQKVYRCNNNNNKRQKTADVVAAYSLSTADQHMNTLLHEIRDMFLAYAILTRKHTHKTYSNLARTRPQNNTPATAAATTRIKLNTNRALLRHNPKNRRALLLLLLPGARKPEFRTSSGAALRKVCGCLVAATATALSVFVCWTLDDA